MASTSSSSSSGIYFYMNPEGTRLQSGQCAWSKMQQEVQKLSKCTITLTKVYDASMKCFRGYIVIDCNLNTDMNVSFMSLSLHREGDMAVSSPMTKAEAKVHLIAMKRKAPRCDPRPEQIDQDNVRCVMKHPDTFDQAIANLSINDRLRTTPLPMQEFQFIANRLIYANTPKEKVLSIWKELEQESQHLEQKDIEISPRSLIDYALQYSKPNKPSSSSSSAPWPRCVAFEMEDEYLRHLDKSI